MVLTLKHKLSYYRRFRSDIWGLYKLSCRENAPRKYKRVSKFFYQATLERRKNRYAFKKTFIYRLDIVEPKRKRRYIKKRFISLRIVRLFYLTLTYKQFRLLARLARRKDGLFENHYCLLLEGRLISFVYRTSFFASMFDALRVVKSSFVYVNRKPTNFVNRSVNIFDILSFHPMLKSEIYLDIIYRFKNRIFLFKAPKYMFVSYWFLYAFMKKYPRRKYLSFPCKIDIYRATGFAF